MGHLCVGVRQQRQQQQPAGLTLDQGRGRRTVGRPGQWDASRMKLNWAAALAAVWAASSLCPFHVNLQHSTKWLYIFFSDCPFASASPPAPPSPASYVCACVRVCSNFSSLIMALAVANITQPHSTSSSSSGTNSSSNKRSQRPLRFTPLSHLLCHHPRAPCCCCCWDVSRTLRCCQLMWACTAATSASPSSICPFPLFRPASSPPPPSSPCSATVDYFMRFLCVFMRILCLYFWRKVFVKKTLEWETRIWSTWHAQGFRIRFYTHCTHDLIRKFVHYWHVVEWGFGIFNLIRSFQQY